MTTATVQSPRITIFGRRLDLFWPWVGLLALGLLAGVIGGYQVLRYGLEITGLTNQVAWGLWIVIDLSSIALGGGAFTMGAIVYILGIKRYEHIGKLAVLLGFLGYSTAGLVLLFDLGQPLRFWHPVVFWQPHSLLWEITMCVVLYLTVLLLEMIPTVVEHPFFDRFPFLVKVGHFIHRFTPVLAVLGMTLSLLHQASLGATYGVLSGRGLWFSPNAPVVFVLSAVGGGLGLLFVLGVLAFRVMRPGLVKDNLLYDVALISGSVMLLTLYLVVWDWAVTNYYSFDNLIAQQLELLNSVAPYSASFWFSQVFFALIPGFILITAKKHRNIRLTVAAGLLVAAYAVLMRWNYNLSGLTASITYDPFTPEIQINSYIPTLPEFMVGIGVISYWWMGFTLATRFLPFGYGKMSGEHDHGHDHADEHAQAHA